MEFLEIKEENTVIEIKISVRNINKVQVELKRVSEQMKRE